MNIFATSLWTPYTGIEFSEDKYITNALWRDVLLKYGNITFTELEKSQLVFLFISFTGEKFKFDESLANKIEFLQIPIIIFDYSEYGQDGAWDRLFEYNIFGYNTEYYNILNRKDSLLLHGFLERNQHLIKCYFKRELNNNTDNSKIPFKVFPIEYISDNYIYNNLAQTSDEYFNRKIHYSFIGGSTNRSRIKLYGNILKNIDKFRCEVATSFKQCDKRLEENSHFIFLNHVQWYERTEYKKLLEYQLNTRVVMDMYGCGLKCFRNVESTYNSLSAKQDPTVLKFTHPWIDKENCIVLPNKPGTLLIDEKLSVEILLYYRKNQHLLYPIYLKSLDTNKLYSPANYVPNHVMKNIKESL